MKFNFGSLAALGLVLLTACGTFVVEAVPQDTSTPAPLNQSDLVTTSSPGPDQCSGFPVETSLPDNPDDPRSYVGHHYDELAMPGGLAFMGAGMLNDTTLWEWVSRPGFDMEFLTQMICRKPDGSTYNVVVDAVIIPREQEGYARAQACLPLPSGDPVIVFGKYDSSQPETTLLGVQGWKMFDLDFGQQIDLKAMRFRPLPLDGIECVHISGLGS